MPPIVVDRSDGVAVARLSRGKVNALNEETVEALQRVLSELADDVSVPALVLTGSGKFFSFGFDIPELLAYSKPDFERFLVKFTGLYTSLFCFPKPVVAAINGHCIAGGCMLTNACDYRLMAGGTWKIGLNELAFGAAVFAGSVAILRNLVGQNVAEKVLIGARMYSPEEALQIGLVDRLAGQEELLAEAQTTARGYAEKDAAAYAQLKRLLRQPVVERYRELEAESIRRFNDIWYAPEMRQRLAQIRIRT